MVPWCGKPLSPSDFHAYRYKGAVLGDRNSSIGQLGISEFLSIPET